MKKVLTLVCAIVLGISALTLSGCSGFSSNVDECITKIKRMSSDIDYSKTISIKAKPIGREGMTYKKEDLGGGKFEEYYAVNYEITFTNISDRYVLFDDKIYIPEQISEVQGYSVLSPSSSPIKLEPGKRMRFSCEKYLLIPEKTDAAQMEELANTLYIEMSIDGRMAYVKVSQKELETP